MNQNKDDASFLLKKYHLTLLFDFYGELLKESNRQIYEDYILNDMSLGEIALERGISRQGIYDTIKRTVKKLEGYEDKIHLIERYEIINSKVDDIKNILDDMRRSSKIDRENLDKLVEIENILNDINHET